MENHSHIDSKFKDFNETYINLFSSLDKSLKSIKGSIETLGNVQVENVGNTDKKENLEKQDKNVKYQATLDIIKKKLKGFYNDIDEAKRPVYEYFLGLLHKKNELNEKQVDKLSSIDSSLKELTENIDTSVDENDESKGGIFDFLKDKLDGVFEILGDIFEKFAGGLLLKGLVKGLPFLGVGLVAIAGGAVAAWAGREFLKRTGYDRIFEKGHDDTKGTLMNSFAFPSFGNGDASAANMFMGFGTSIGNYFNPEKSNDRHASTGENNGDDVSPQERVPYTIKFLKAKGLNESAIAGIIGNLMQESGLDPHREGADGEHGIAQWRLKRRTDFKQIFGIDITKSTFKQQIDYLWFELNNKYKNVLNRINNTRNSNDATKIFMDEFEIPRRSDANLPRRQYYSNTVKPFLDKSNNTPTAKKPDKSNLTSQVELEKKESKLAQMQQVELSTSSANPLDIINQSLLSTIDIIQERINSSNRTFIDKSSKNQINSENVTYRPYVLDKSYWETHKEFC